MLDFTEENNQSCLQDGRLDWRPGGVLPANFSLLLCLLREKWKRQASGLGLWNEVEGGPAFWNTNDK